MAAFSAWLESPATQAQMRVVLPDHIALPSFIAAAKTAVITNPQLLKPDWRNSLLDGVTKAAAMGLIPDGKQGVLVPRWDDRAKKTQIAWQAMIWGIVRLGRLTGAIKSIRAQIVFLGENFEIDEVSGDITHRRGANERKIVDDAYAALRGPPNEYGRPTARVDAFMDRIDCAYCVIIAADGTQTVRWMSAERLRILRASASAKGGPWAGLFVDEMCLKAVILYTAKHIDLDVNNAATGRFRAAMEADLDVDFDALDAHAARVPAALPPPGAKLGVLEGMLARTAAPAEREPVTVTNIVSEPEDRRQEPPRTTEPERKEPKVRSPRTREAWVAEQESLIATRPDHDALTAHRKALDYSQRYDVLRQENPELAKRLVDAFAARTVAIGPPDGEQGDAS